LHRYPCCCRSYQPRSRPYPPEPASRPQPVSSAIWPDARMGRGAGGPTVASWVAEHGPIALPPPAQPCRSCTSTTDCARTTRSEGVAQGPVVAAVSARVQVGWQTAAACACACAGFKRAAGSMLHVARAAVYTSPEPAAPARGCETHARPTPPLRGWGGRGLVIALKCNYGHPARYRMKFCFSHRSGHPGRT